MNRIRLCLLAIVTICSTHALAQNTGGIFGPVINEDHHAWQYRATFDPDSNVLVQRFHYEAAPTGSTMWRVIGQVRKTDERDADFDFVQGEWFWQMTPDNERWQRGLRVDARVRSDGRPGLLGLHFMNEYALSPDWLARVVLLSNIDIGDNARDGLNLEVRGFILNRAAPNTQWGVEFYNPVGSTDKFNSFSDQQRQIGPFVVHNFGNRWQLFGGALFGATDATPDTNWRIWLTKFW